MFKESKVLGPQILSSFRTAARTSSLLSPQISFSAVASDSNGASNLQTPSARNLRSDLLRWGPPLSAEDKNLHDEISSLVMECAEIVRRFEREMSFKRPQAF